jgi:hypothetical protein
MNDIFTYILIGAFKGYVYQSVTFTQTHGIQ